MSHTLENFDLYSVPSPCYVIDEAKLEQNLKTLQHVQQRSGAKVLLALKAFSFFESAPLIMRYLQGTCASGLYEAKLGREEYGGEVHTYAAAYREDEIEAVLKLSDHVVFNSFSQWNRHKTKALNAQKERPSLRFGLRINPEHSEGATPIYDPCAPCSRMGITAEKFSDADLTGISGLHFHTLCEQNFDALDRTLSVIEKKFARYLPNMEWINFGGGHHITHNDYEVDALIERIRTFSDQYTVQVYLEPGEAIALNAGILVSEVLDIIDNNMTLGIMDTSATCHMPDVLEMPYRPRITGSDSSNRDLSNCDLSNCDLSNNKAHTIRLGGPSCLSGDVIGDYSFDQALTVGDRVMFEDMAIYTMVKNTTFNGIPLPSIAITNSGSGHTRLVKQFSYQDFKVRLS